MDTEKIKQVVMIFEQSHISSMNLECEEMKIQLEKNVNPSIQLTETSEPIEQEMTVLKSPLVGTFYRASSPDQAPYVEIGQEVKEGDVVCLLEAMKAMNEIKASKDGIIEDILIEDGQMVEYDQPLMKLRD